ncbi:unnamed protein product [Prunus armeniaca]|uniref:Uncharacterized protein n=1 Tax=Prunus armeniaca TaxID=36596 RepID=A0A6J5TJ42_PRUAR|nr:unnamed protein product [Prunus armeniaca]
MGKRAIRAVRLPCHSRQVPERQRSPSKVNALGPVIQSVSGEPTSHMRPVLQFAPRHLGGRCEAGVGVGAGEEIGCVRVGKKATTLVR